MHKKINLLLVDDNPADLFLIKDYLNDSEILDLNILEASSVKEAKHALSNNPVDLILLDMFLPDSSGVDTFFKVHNDFPKTSIIVLSGLSDKSIALNTVQAGAQDFLLKGEFDGNLLEKSIIYSLERKKNLQLLADSENKYRALFEDSPLPLFILSIESSEIVKVNAEALKMFDYQEEEFKSKKFTDLFTEARDVNSLVEKSQTEDQQFRTIAVKGNAEEAIVDVTLKKIVLLNESFILVQLKDVTEQVNFEKYRLDLINSIQDNERSKFAMELHDGLAQELVLLNIYIDQLKEKFTDSTEITQAKSIITGAMEHTRRLTYDASPPLLKEGFFKGLSVLFERFNDVNDINISLSVDDEGALCEDSISDDVSYNSFRIIQEFLNNSIKHAKAKNISCFLSSKDEYCEIAIEDNGIGFDKNISKNAGMGINNMKKRAKLFQIDFDFQSKPNKGTSLTLRIPKSDGIDL